MGRLQRAIAAVGFDLARSSVSLPGYRNGIGSPHPVGRCNRGPLLDWLAPLARLVPGDGDRPVSSSVDGVAVLQLCREKRLDPGTARLTYRKTNSCHACAPGRCRRLGRAGQMARGTLLCGPSSQSPKYTPPVRCGSHRFFREFATDRSILSRPNRPAIAIASTAATSSDSGTEIHGGGRDTGVGGSPDCRGSQAPGGWETGSRSGDCRSPDPNGIIAAVSRSRTAGSGGMGTRNRLRIGADSQARSSHHSGARSAVGRNSPAD